MKIFSLKLTLLSFLILNFSCAQATAKNNNPEECNDFMESLKQMIQAQESIQKSLIDNHSMMATNMKEFADTIKESNGRAYKEVSQTMYKSSETILKRKEKAESISTKFNEKAEEVLKSAKKCLN